MSAENVELVRRSFNHFRSGDIEGLLAGWAPDIEWDISEHPLPDFPDRGAGRDELLAHFGEYVSGWRNYEMTEGEVIDAGDHVVFVTHERVTLLDSDATLERDLALVWTVADGLLARLRAYPSRAAALQALGV